MPRWVKVAASIVGALVLIFTILQLTGVAGKHGPGRHTLGDVSGPAGVAQQHPRAYGYVG
jgi:hypothetical protein